MIRPARTADAEALAALQNAVIASTDPVITFTSEPRRPEDLAVVIASQPTWVLDQEGPRGFATYGPFRKGPGYARTAEHSILLAPEARGGGWGSALMATLEAHARAAGLHILVAGIGGENAAALRFHARRGFQETARMPEVGWKAGRWQTLVLMQKTLTAPAARG